MERGGGEDKLGERKQEKDWDWIKHLLNCSTKIMLGNYLICVFIIVVIC